MSQYQDTHSSAVKQPGSKFTPPEATNSLTISEVVLLVGVVAMITGISVLMLLMLLGGVLEERNSKKRGALIALMVVVFILGVTAAIVAWVVSG